MNGSLWLILIGSVSVGLASTARAQELAFDAYDTGYLEEVFDVENFDFDSDWIPAGSPIQVRLQIHAGNTLALEMTGDATYDWDVEQMALWGDASGGLFTMDLGLTVTTSLRYDILGNQWEGVVGDPFEFWLYDSQPFLPYLLEGNPDRPLVLSSEIEPQTLIDYPAVDVGIAQASIVIDISGVLDAAFAAKVGTVTRLDGSRAVEILADESLVPLIFADGEGPAEAEAQLTGDITFDSTVSLWPSVVLTLLTVDYELVQFELPLDLPTIDETWTFEPEVVSFERPEVDGDDDDDDDSSDDDDDTDEYTPDNESVDGCNCTLAAAQQPAAALVPALLMGALWRRQRR